LGALPRAGLLDGFADAVGVTSQVDTWAWRATEVKVMGVPSAIIASIALCTRVRRSWLSRRRAAIIASVVGARRVTAAASG